MVKGIECFSAKEWIVTRSSVTVTSFLLKWAKAAIRATEAHSIRLPSVFQIKRFTSICHAFLPATRQRDSISIHFASRTALSKSRTISTVSSCILLFMSMLGEAIGERSTLTLSIPSDGLEDDGSAISPDTVARHRVLPNEAKHEP